MELNIGLNAPNGANSTSAITARRIAAINLLRKALPGLSSGLAVREHVAQYTGPGGAVQREETLIVKAPEGSITRSGINAIAVYTDQDCIAVRFDDGHGELIGPKAVEWGEFNPEFFVRF